MEFLPQTWSELVGPFTLVLCTGLVYLLYHFSKQLNRTRGELMRLKNEYMALASGNIGIGKKLLRLESVIASFRRGRKKTPTGKHNQAGLNKKRIVNDHQATGDRLSTPKGYSQAEAELLKLMRSGEHSIRH